MFNGVCCILYLLYITNKFKYNHKASVDNALIITHIRKIKIRVRDMRTAGKSVSNIGVN